MKKRFSKLMGILLTMVMLVGLMPATAMAADELTAITNVTATSDDLESIPVFNGVRKDPTIEVTEGDPAYFQRGMYRWQRYDEDTEKWNTYNESGRFAIAGEWRLMAQVRTESGTHTLAKEGLNVTVNGESWTVDSVQSGTSNSGTPFSYVSVYSPKFELKDDGSVVTSVTALPLSVIGYKVGADAEDVSVVTTAEGVEIDYILLADTNKDGNSAEIDEDDLEKATGQIEAGKNYVVQVKVVPKVLYDITDLEEDDVTMTGANLMLFVNQYLYGGPCFAVGLLPVLEADADANVIKEFEATVTAPTAGAAPSAEVTVPEGKGYSGGMVYWYNTENGEKTTALIGGVFEEGKTYLAEVVLYPDRDKTVADDAEGAVNGKDAEVSIVNASENKSVELKVLFNVPSSVIDAVEATVTKPVAGANPSFEATENDERYDAYDVYWMDGNKIMQSSDVFEAGKTYTAEVWFIPESGYTFADDVTAEINGKDADKVNTANEDGSKAIAFTREFTVPAKNNNNGGGGGSTKYKVVLEDTDNGIVESSRTKASKGTTVYITTDPDAGYDVDDIKVTKKNGEEVEVTDKGDGRFAFKMPAAAVYVDVQFEEVADGTGNGVEEYILLTIDSVIAWVFDEYVTNDVAPVIRNERTMLPARFVAEALGGVVTWDEAAQKVTIVNGEDTIVIFIGEPFATVNGDPVELDSPAFIENDRTYLPIRFIAENMGATVTWNDTARTVKIVPGE